MSDVMDLVLSRVRTVLGGRGQANPVDDHTIRVTYPGGGFHLLDIAGFAGDTDPQRIGSWVATMLTPATGSVPPGLLPVIWAERGAPTDAFVTPIGVGLVVGVVRDGTPVDAIEAAGWGARPEEILTAARRELAAQPFSPRHEDVDGQTLVLLESPAGAANGWALFPSLLKSATGVDDRQVVFLPDQHVCCVVAAPRTAELEVAQQWAAVRYAQAERPVSPAAYVMEGTQLVRWPG